MNNDKNDSIAGARASLAAIRAMETIATNAESQAYYLQREQMVSTLLNAAEPLSPYMKGFLTVLAEYIDLSLGCGNRPDRHWTPEAVMTDNEVQGNRSRSYATVSSG